MSKKHMKKASVFAILLLAVTMIAVPAFAAPEDYTITVTTDVNSVKPGDIVTVNVAVNGAQFCAAQMDLSYDANSFEYVSTMSGWSDNGNGRLGLLRVKSSDGYWEDGKSMGTLKFLVKDTAAAGEAEFGIDASRDAFIIGDWAEGASEDPPVALNKEQLGKATVNVTNDGTAAVMTTDLGAVSDDGMTLNLEAGHKVYTIADTENASAKVIWKSENEAVATVDENGLITAVSDGQTVITATDEAGNDLEQRTVVVGEMPENTTPETTTEGDGAADSGSGFPIWLIIVAAVVIAAVVIAIAAGKKRDN